MDCIHLNLSRHLYLLSFFHAERRKQELYRHVSVVVGSNEEQSSIPWTMDRGLEEFFKPEQRDIKCEKCKVGTSATQTMTILSRSKALLLHLKRFLLESKPAKESNSRFSSTVSFRKNKVSSLIVYTIYCIGRVTQTFDVAFFTNYLFHPTHRHW